MHLDAIVVGLDAVDAVPVAVAAQLARTAEAGRRTGGPVVVLVEATPIERAGADLKALVTPPAPRSGALRRARTRAGWPPSR